MIVTLAFIAVLYSGDVLALTDTHPQTLLSDIQYVDDFYPPQSGLIPRTMLDQIGAAMNPNIRNAFQVWRASPTDTFPTFRLPGLNADPDSYKLKPCARKNITNCIFTGDANDNLPDFLQGIWWQDGIGVPSGPIGGGPFDAEKRRWTWLMTVPKRWAWDSRDAPFVMVNGSFPITGALAYNYVSTLQMLYHVDFNEDFTHAQINMDMFSPPYTWKVPHQLVNYTMFKIDNNTWQRVSTVWGWPVEEGTYVLRKITDAEGNPIQPAFDKFTNSAGGTDVLVAEKV